MATLGPTLKALQGQLGVEVNVSPKYQGGVPSTTLTYAVTITNIGDVQDTYILTVSDNSGWGPTLSENLLENVAPGRVGIVALSVTIPSGGVCTMDNIVVVATSMTDNTVKSSGESIAHLGKAKISLSIVYCYGWGVSIDLNLLLREDSHNLVLKFYSWGDTYWGENVLWSGTTPAQVAMIDNVRSPVHWYIPQKVRLVLTDGDNSEVQTIITFVTCRVHLLQINIHIKALWPYVENKSHLWPRWVEIKANWPYAPS